jgi:hypothetical protein
MTECKYPGCDKQRRLGNWFCSTLHRLKYEHVEMDAKHVKIAEEHPPNHNDR